MTKQLIDIQSVFGGGWKSYLVERENGVKTRTPITDFNDYFYIGEDRLDEIKENEYLMEQVIDIHEEIKKKPLFYDGKIYKVILKGHWSKFKFAKIFGKNLTHIFELDVPFAMRYAIDNIKSFEKTNYRTLFFDIETTTKFGFPEYTNAIENITCISMFDSYEQKYYLYVLKPENWNEKWKYLETKEFEEKTEVIFFDDEKQMLESFIDMVQKNDYDILTAWNSSFDFCYIFGRCDTLNIHKEKLSPYGNVHINTKMNKQNREEIEVTIDGRFTVDLLQRYKAITFKEIPSYSLEYVSNLELGEESRKKERILDFTKEWTEYLERLIEYSIRDTKVMVELDNKLKLIDYMEELRLISYSPNITSAGVAKQLIDMSLFREFGSQYVFPSKSGLEKVNLGGGYVFPPVLGVYDWVAVYDFSGMYPSIMRTFNLSKDTVVEDLDKADFVTHEDDVELLPKDIGRKGFKTGWSLNKKGMMPTILENIIGVRMAIKKEMKGLDKNSIEWREKNLKQYALKAPINAMYGVNCYNGFRLFEPRVSATITYLGRSLNKYCSKRIEEDYKLKIVGSDTDSFFVHIGENNLELMNKIQKDINEKYVKEFIEKIGKGKIKDNYINIEFEKIYEKVLMIKKRRYLGKIYNGDWEYKGVDLKRSNTPEIIRMCLQRYIDVLFESKEPNILEITKMLYEKKGQIDLFKIPLKLSKDYQTELPQKRAADWANKNLKSNFKQGSKFYGLWVEGKYDIIGFSDINELKNFTINLDMNKYKTILLEKMNNLRSDDDEIKLNFDIYQTTL